MNSCTFEFHDERFLIRNIFNSKCYEKPLSIRAAEAYCTSIYDRRQTVNLVSAGGTRKAETEKNESNLINNIAPTLIAKECNKREITVIHFSTDYVFGGEGAGPFQPDDKKFPVNEYGKSKSLGEDNILKENSNSLIIRVASVFGHFGNNFVKTMTKLVLTKDEVNIVSDNQISMFYANDFSSNISKILDLFYKQESPCSHHLELK